MTTATDMLAQYLAAEQAILLGKQAQIGDRNLRMEDLLEVRKGRTEWEMRVQAEAAGSKIGSIGGRGFSVARLDGG